jgi:hypothetical protein
MLGSMGALVARGSASFRSALVAAETLECPGLAEGLGI